LASFSLSLGSDSGSHSVPPLELVVPEAPLDEPPLPLLFPPDDDEDEDDDEAAPGLPESTSWLSAPAHALTRTAVQVSDTAT